MSPTAEQNERIAATVRQMREDRAARGEVEPVRPKELPMVELEARRVYRLYSRNLLVGAWVPEQRGFIGIRTKFGHSYLFMEYHREIGPPYGTARAYAPFDPPYITLVPEDIALTESLGLMCTCGRAAKNIPGATRPGPWDRHADDGSVIEITDDEAYEHSAYREGNDPLLNFLEPLHLAERQNPLI